MIKHGVSHNPSTHNEHLSHLQRHSNTNYMHDSKLLVQGQPCEHSLFPMLGADAQHETEHDELIQVLHPALDSQLASNEDKIHPKRCRHRVQAQLTTAMASWLGHILRSCQSYKSEQNLYQMSFKTLIICHLTSELILTMMWQALLQITHREMKPCNNVVLSEWTRLWCESDMCKSEHQSGHSSWDDIE